MEEKSLFIYGSVEHFPRLISQVSNPTKALNYLTEKAVVTLGAKAVVPVHRNKIVLHSDTSTPNS